MKDLTEVIIKKFLNPSTSPHLLSFGVKFENEKLIKKCEEQLKNVFQDIKKPVVEVKDDCVDKSKDPKREPTPHELMIEKEKFEAD